MGDTCEVVCLNRVFGWCFEIGAQKEPSSLRSGHRLPARPEEASNAVVTPGIRPASSDSWQRASIACTASRKGCAGHPFRLQNACAFNDHPLLLSVGSG